MQVFQTAGVPPRSGNTIFAIMGWTRKSSAALRNSVAEKNNCKYELPMRRGRSHRRNGWHGSAALGKQKCFLATFTKQGKIGEPAGVARPWGGKAEWAA